VSYDIELLRGILKAAVEGGASDVHIKVGTPVVLRIHRQLLAIEAPIPTVEWMEKILEKMVPVHAKKRLDADREVDFSYLEPGVGRFRTNVFQQRGTMALAMRYVKTQVPSFSELGLSPVIKDIARSPRGIVLVAGTTGSGKSTTLAAMIEYINANFKKHVVTLEDPIEFVFEDNQSVVEQREIGLDTTSFATGLKHVLRQDPDIIMVGEMRDLETISLAITAAETGHLVLGTLHTGNAARTLDRVLDVFPPDQRDQIRIMVSESLRGILSQQLVPQVDGNGRVMAMEVLVNTPAVASCIREGKTFMLNGVMQTGKNVGMVPMDESLRNLYSKNLITREECESRAEDKQQMRSFFKS